MKLRRTKQRVSVFGPPCIHADCSEISHMKLYAKHELTSLTLKLSQNRRLYSRCTLILATGGAAEIFYTRPTTSVWTDA